MGMIDVEGLDCWQISLVVHGTCSVALVVVEGQKRYFGREQGTDLRVGAKHELTKFSIWRMISSFADLPCGINLELC